ncbi:MAG: DNA recombination protein RmuC [Defluviitaleaceae bacterium]|nr:DNA recombination protein RmuC [Defluviitaleaceae bacterium]
MSNYLIFNFIIIILLIVNIVLQLVGKKETDLSKIEAFLKKSIADQRSDISKQLSEGATEQFIRFGEISKNIQNILQANRMETNDYLRRFSEDTHKNIEKINVTLETKITALQASNEKRLEQMQAIVDEKLQKTLETRLTRSFETVGKHLESVQQGLGEMKSLAQDAKSLKNALTNVKERGTYGEVRLERLLEDILTTSQYEKNAIIGETKIVEFAIKLPGNGDTPLLLPIDSKFPIEDYNRLIAAEEKSQIESFRQSLFRNIRQSAKDISDKYILPPKTTNFALMFLPTEGLYAEVIRDAAFFEELREKFNVIVVGAVTLSAFLGSLQIGFKTLAIEKRSGEVWETLGKVKLEFSKFQGALNTAHKQIKTAEGTLEKLTGTRMRAIERALRDVEALESEEVSLLDFEEEV